MKSNRTGPWIVVAMLVAGISVGLFGVWWHVAGPGARVREQLQRRGADPSVPAADPAESPLTRPWTAQ